MTHTNDPSIICPMNQVLQPPQPALAAPEERGQAELLQRLRSDDRFRAERVEALMNGLRRQAVFASLGIGTVIVMDLVSGEHLIAPNRLGGLQAFKQRFGNGRTVGWLHEIGGGIVVGGGVGGQNPGER
jgi:hypothetical protein